MRAGSASPRPAPPFSRRSRTTSRLEVDQIPPSTYRPPSIRTGTGDDVLHDHAGGRDGADVAPFVGRRLRRLGREVHRLQRLAERADRLLGRADDDRLAIGHAGFQAARFFTVSVLALGVNLIALELLILARGLQGLGAGIEHHTIAFDDAKPDTGANTERRVGRVVVAARGGGPHAGVEEQVHPGRPAERHPAQVQRRAAHGPFHGAVELAGQGRHGGDVQLTGHADGDPAVRPGDADRHGTRRLGPLHAPPRP